MENYTTDGIEIANNIRAERNRKNKTQNEVADAIGMSRKTYIKMEQNASLLKTTALAKIAIFLECTIEHFYMQDKSTKRE